MENPFELTLRVSRSMQILKIFFAFPFIIGAVWALDSVFKGSTLSLIWFLLCALVAYFGWANALSTIRITEESVTVTVFYGRFRINWIEVNKIILNTPFIALMGNDKRLVLSRAYAGRNSGKMLEFFNLQIETRKIEFEQNSKPFPLTHRNVRVWR